MTDKVPAGTVCVVTGLTKTRPGDGIGAEANSINPELEPLYLQALEDHKQYADKIFEFVFPNSKNYTPCFACCTNT